MNTAAPLVTVAIPVYNAGHYLAYAIQSVLNQTFTDFELLLLNDGSTDDSLKIIHSFTDPRIRLIDDGENKGLIYRLNQSINLAGGKYYARMDADDIMHPERLRKQIDFLESNPDHDLVGSAFYLIDAENNISSAGQLPADPRMSDIINNRAFLHPSVTAKVEWLVNHPYDQRFVRIEDKELWLRTVSSATWCNLSEPLMFYRALGVQMLGKYLKTQRSNFYLMYCYRKQISASVFVRECVKTVIKIVVYTLLVSCRMQNRLIRLRGTGIDSSDCSSADRQYLQAAIADIPVE